MTIDSIIRPSMPTTNVAKEFVQQLKECASTKGASKAMASTLMAELTTKKFDWSKSMHNHITNMVNLSTRLKNLKVEVSEEWMVEIIINSLPNDFESFSVSYNNLEKKWTLPKLKAKVIQEEARLRKDGKANIAHVTD
ncbi:hypothetical protein HRI_000264800 [Hibiscus trionum]|uniref:UBN2 domain-containing protein n=1 Tax=Hibiscus trionum TaxID=183268 RepID=A0A9W7GUP5_HIBTR|nr:hypothetical protein HRI_000264800 [Hibiscus trionum]